MLYFIRVCQLVPKQLTDLSAALEPADKKGLKNWAIIFFFWGGVGV
jgi:hypothetical protein